MKHENSIVMIIPAANKDQAEAVEKEEGINPGYGVPLSPTGNTPITHYGLHSWHTSDEKTELEQVPAKRSNYARYNRVYSANREDSKTLQKLRARDHFLAVLSERNLQIIEESE